MCSKNEALVILSEVNERIREKYGDKVCDCYLYGSYARGDYHSRSDVDIAVIFDIDKSRISKTTADVGEIMSDLSMKHDVTVSIATISADVFNRYACVTPFYKSILEEGIKQ